MAWKILNNRPFVGLLLFHLQTFVLLFCAIKIRYLFTAIIFGGQKAKRCGEMKEGSNKVGGSR